MSRVALIGENSISYISALIDIWNNGDCAVLLDRQIPFQVAVNIMVEAGVHQCYIERELLESAKEQSGDDIEFISYDLFDQSIQLLPNDIYDKFQANYTAREAVIVYSSETVDQERGVILSHFAINKKADAMIDYIKVSATDRIYVAQPLSHASTLIGELLVALKARISLIIAPRVLSPSCVLSNIRKSGATIAFLNSAQLSSCADEYSQHQTCKTSLRAIYVNGTAMTDETHEKAQVAFDNIPIYNTYGKMEAASYVTAQRPFCYGRNSVGKPLKGIEITIVNANGRVAPVNQHGIIHIRTIAMFSGYVTGGVRFPSLYRNWFNTGDIGYFDCNHELHIVCHIDDEITICSKKVYPNFVEQQISKLSQIDESVVVKISLDETAFLACVYTGQEQNRDEIYRHLSDRLLSYEIPRIFLRVNEIPRNINGKPDRGKIQELITEQVSSN